jgi:hypothetical protein
VQRCIERTPTNSLSYNLVGIAIGCVIRNIEEGVEIEWGKYRNPSRTPQSSPISVMILHHEVWESNYPHLLLCFYVGS